MPTLGTISDRIGFTKPPHGSPLFFVSPVAVRKVDQKVSTTTVISSTAETLLASFALPALTLVNQGGARAIVGGTIRNHVTAGGTIILRSKITIGASTVTLMESSAISLSTSANLRSWQAGVAVVGTTLSTSIRTWNEAAITSPTTRPTAPLSATLSGQKTASIPNSSASGTIKFTAKLSAASTGLSASVVAGWLETVS